MSGLIAVVKVALARVLSNGGLVRSRQSSEWVDVVDPADPQDRANNSDGWYELALHFGTSDAATVDTALRELDRRAGVKAVPGGSIVRLPDGPWVVCAHYVVEEEGGSLWVMLGLPLGSLGRADPRVGDYPFGTDSGATWRRPLDDWLASVAVRLFDVLPFDLAVVGFEVSGEMDPAQFCAAAAGEHDHVGIITVTDRPIYHPATG